MKVSEVVVVGVVLLLVAAALEFWLTQEQLKQELHALLTKQELLEHKLKALAEASAEGKRIKIRGFAPAACCSES